MNPKGPNLKSKNLLETLAHSVHFDASSLSLDMIVDRKSNTVTVIEVQFSKEALNFKHFFFWWNRYIVYLSMFIGPNVGLIIDCGVITVSF